MGTLVSLQQLYVLRSRFSPGCKFCQFVYASRPPFLCFFRHLLLGLSFNCGCGLGLCNLPFNSLYLGDRLNSIQTKKGLLCEVHVITAYVVFVCNLVTPFRSSSLWRLPWDPALNSTFLVFFDKPGLSALMPVLTSTPPNFPFRTFAVLMTCKPWRVLQHCHL